MADDQVSSEATTAPSVPAVIPEHTTSLTSKIISGSVAGVVGILSIYPIDFAKTRLQASMGKGSSRQYNGLFDCFVQNVRRHGIRYMYRGIQSNLAGIAPEKAIKLTVADVVRERLDVWRGHRSALHGALGGVAAGTCQLIVTNPMEIVKIRMQTVSSAVAKPSALHVVRELGIRGLFRGTSATFFRDIPFNIVFFGLNDYLKIKLADENGVTPFPSVLGAGLASGGFAAWLSTPMDVIKTRIQAGKAEIEGQSMSQEIKACASKIMSEYGPAGFFRGAIPRILTIAPLFGIALLTYEVQQRVAQNAQIRRVENEDN